MCRARHTQNAGEGPGLLRGFSGVSGLGKFIFLSEVLGFKSLAPQLRVGRSIDKGLLHFNIFKFIFHKLRVPL